MLEQNAQINLNGDEIELPIHTPTLGQKVIDVKRLSQHGFFTFDPGFIATASCESKITYIDGEKGELLHRGYPIEQLAEYANYIELCYLLIHGKLPKAREKKQFKALIAKNMAIDKILRKVLAGFSRDAHPMAMLVSLTGALAGQYHGTLDYSTENGRQEAASLLVAKIPTLAAMCYRYGQEKTFVNPKIRLDYASNFLNMMFYDAQEKKEPNPVIAKALDKIFILHADHEQNASTSTVRLAGSTGADPFACVAAGITALWGPAHGGANEATLAMLKEIGNVAQIKKYIEKAKDKNDPFRLMGFGHRVYKNYDPRATVMRETCYEVLKETNKKGPLLDIALELEQIALKDDYFIEKKLYPNVDFYSGITLSAIGIPTNMFTVIFALARTVGWVAHWLEMINDPQQRIGRPRQLYTGEKRRDYK